MNVPNVKYWYLEHSNGFVRCKQKTDDQDINHPPNKSNHPNMPTRSQNKQINNRAGAVWRYQTFQEPRDPILICKDVVYAAKGRESKMIFALVVLFQKAFSHHRCFKQSCHHAFGATHLCGHSWPAELRFRAATLSWNDNPSNRRRKGNVYWRTSESGQRVLVKKCNWWQ